MSLRISIFGKGQGLDGDTTTTGAICIASQGRGRSNGNAWLLEGDKTTACPRCGETGTLVEGEACWTQDGIPTAVDGTLVRCGCPLGDNRVVAPLHIGPAPRRTNAVAAVSDALPQACASSHAMSGWQPSAGPTAAMQGMAPGFYIVPRCMTYQDVLIELGAPQANLPRSILERLNPTHQQGFKAGEIFVIGDGLSRPAYTQEELQVMSAAKQAREALASLTTEEANFMMRHQAEIAGLFSELSLSMGVSESAMAKALDELTTTLRKIEELHQQQFSKHGHLRSAEFFTERSKLFKLLDTQLRMTFLNKRLDLGRYETLRRDLGISSRSLVHHWSKAGAPDQIPGYSTHLHKLAVISKYLKAGGYVGIAVGGGSSILKVQEACTSGTEHVCKKIKFMEAGNFSGGLAGGTAGAIAGKLVAGFACVSLGPVSATACAVAIVGAGSYVGSVGGTSIGEYAGEKLYESTERD
ncbi:PAAR domain-containing protein [Pseudomonas sp. SK]|uniref:PAAR domain-containing protein n=1 Tax=Pseudomonas sp. SK TaxID=2729423 RepID=UPI00146376BD|nr:PAAR domain-containing protein [Pseudomonas sp. SK]QJQ23079.1 PAAR domain-containing protein [Pseudomonas sp. SK]